MTTVLLCGKIGENISLVRAVANAARRYGGAQLCAGGRILEEKHAEFLIYECERLPQIQAEKGILILKDSFSGKISGKLPGGFLAVFGSSNAEAARALEGTGIPALTCGTGVRDTVSAASLGFPHSVASLQRSIRTLMGTVVEPHDIPLTLCEPYSPGPLLTAAAMLLAAGIPSGKGYTF